MASANDPSHTPANAVAAMAAAMKKRKIDEEHLDAPAAKCPFQETSSHGNVTSPVTDQARQSNRPKRFASLKRKREKFIKEQNIVAPALEVSSTGLQTGPHQDRNQPSPTSHDTSEHCEEETHCHSSKRPRTNDPSPTKPPSGAQTSATVCSAQPSTAHHLSASAATKSSNGLKSKAQCCKFSHYSTTRGRRSTRRVPPTETLSNGTPQNPQVGTCAHANIHRTEALKPSPSVLSAQNEPVSGKAKAKPSVLGVSSTSKTNMKSANPSDIVADRIERGQALTTLFPDTRSTQQLARTQFPAGISIDEHPELDQRSIKEWEAQRAMDIEDREDRARRRDQIRRRNRLRNDERDAKAFEAQMQYPTTAHSQSHTWKQNPPSLQRHFLPCYKGVLKTQQRRMRVKLLETRAHRIANRNQTPKRWLPARHYFKKYCGLFGLEYYDRLKVLDGIDSVACEPEVDQGSTRDIVAMCTIMGYPRRGVRDGGVEEMIRDMGLKEEVLLPGR